MLIGLFVAMSLTLLLLFGFLFAILAAIGYFFAVEAYIIVAMAVFLVFIQWLIGPKVIWWTTNMRLLEKDEYPWLRRTVEELCKRHKVPMPRLALARSGAPNAFVFGRTPKGATLAVTQGLLDALTQEEVKGVLAHEIGHIKHKDMIVMTVVSAIPIIMYFIARFLIFAPRAGERREAGAAIVIGIAAFLVYFITNLLVLYLSRLREYYSDHFGGLATKPHNLASALAKITYGLSLAPSQEKAKAGAAKYFFIADPVEATGEIARFSSHYADMHISKEEVKEAMEWEKRNPLMKFMEVFRTHPLTYKRIARLQELEREASKLRIEAT
ncbi:MAG: zinc metalloprotease HtpX [Candidatus Aenigmatarchaeota archaeon]